MTSAPADLLGFRTTLLQVTGLSGNALGISPDPRHLNSGGYHVSPADIRRIGRYDTDYSTRQARDRNVGGSAASAVDIGSAWKTGRAAWLRFNNLLYQEMRDRPQNLPALRAINVSLDGKAKRRYDQNGRGAGLISSTDTVDTHTHLEFWRDTEGRRQATLDRIVELARAAAANTTPTSGDDMSADTEAIIKAWSVGMPTASTGSTVEPVKWRINDEAWQKRIDATVAAVAADTKANRVAVEALTAALNKGGGSVDSAAVIAHMDLLAAGEIAREQELLARIAELEAEVEQGRAAAVANLSPAERASLDKP